MAHAEIYILNYNGAPFLPVCLASLLSLETGTHTVHINVIDNCSTDESAVVVRTQFPSVQFIALDQNYGFSKGNNLGAAVRISQLQAQKKKADVHVFLNNDTAVDSDWLLEGLRCLESYPRAGIVGSKSLFYDRFIALKVRCSSGFKPSDHGAADTRELGLFLSGGISGENLLLQPGRAKFLPRLGEEQHGTWLAPEGTLFLAVADPTKAATLEVVLQNHNPFSETISAEVSLGSSSQPFHAFAVKRGEDHRLALSFEPADYAPLIQNAGSFLRRDWQAGDRGFLQFDNGQYDKTEEVDAVCGVSLFIRDSLWRILGGFDETYFAYYEDTDLSLRARLLGYTCLYNPRSVLRHVHCGSAVEHSEYFQQNVVWSNLVFGSKMMGRNDWREKLHLYQAKAAQEFALFKDDYIMLQKPFLRAYCRYLKNYPLFLRNRIYSWRYRPGKALFNDREPAAVEFVAGESQ